MFQITKNGGKMKTNRIFILIVITLTILCSTLLRAQIETVSCYKSDGTRVAVGSTWEEYYNGVKYICTCRQKGGPDCVPASSSSSSSSGSSNSFEREMMQSVVQPVIQNFFNWLFSPSKPQKAEPESEAEKQRSEAERAAIAAKQAEAKARAEEQERKWAEYRVKMQEQIAKAKNEYASIMAKKFENQKEENVNDFKNRYAKSEAVSNITKLNCAAYQSIEAAKFALSGNENFTDLEGPLEKARASADFASSKLSDCPKIKIDIPEVSATNPVSFQQVFYETIKFKVDSIKANVIVLQEKRNKIEQTVQEKKQSVKELETNNSTNKDDSLRKKALQQLKEAMEEEKKIDQELNNCKKSIEAFEKLRSTFDTKEE